MKNFLLPFLLFAAVTTGIAQTATDDYYGSPAKPKLLSKDRVSASIMAGTGVSFAGNSKTTGFTTFIAPKINYQLTNRFRLNIGMMHYTASPNTAFFLNSNEAVLNSRNKTTSGNLIMVGGDYLLNKRMILSGAVMVDANSLSNRQNNYKAATIGLDYKISEHSSIEFRATVSQGNTDYFYNPQKGSFQYNPLNGTPASLFGGFGEWGTDALNGSIR